MNFLSDKNYTFAKKFKNHCFNEGCWPAKYLEPEPDIFLSLTSPISKIVQ